MAEVIGLGFMISSLLASLEWVVQALVADHMSKYLVNGTIVLEIIFDLVGQL